MLLNRCSDYKCAQTYIQIPCAYNYTFWRVNEFFLAWLPNANYSPLVQLQSVPGPYDPCLDLLSAVVVTDFMRRQWC